MTAIRIMKIVLASALAVACSSGAAAAKNATGASSRFQAVIQKGLVVKGMSLEEASAAGGMYLFDIQGDRAVWPDDTDPWQILAAQRLHPDNSKIRLLFENKTQYSTPGRVQFTVEFVHGRVVGIERGWHFLGGTP